MSESFNSDGVQIAWNSSSIKLAEACLRKYYYKMIEGWQPETLSVHLRFGQHYASALEQFHKHVALGVDREEAIEAVVLEALIATWDGDAPWESEHNTKTRANLIRTIVWYLDHYAEDACTTVILSDGSPAVEHSVALAVDNGITFTAHLDRFVNYASHTYVQDQKTTGTTLTARYFEGYSPDTQMSMYTFLGKTALSLPVQGVMIDAAQIAVGFSRFERGFTFRTDDQLNEWYDDAMRVIERAQTATRENYFPMNPSSCGNFGGCEFRDVCSRSPSVREQFLKSKFVRGPIFDPLEQR